MRGDGSLFKRGKTWYMQYRSGGETIKASCKTSSKEVAREMLRVATGRLRGSEVAHQAQRIAAIVSGNQFFGDPLLADLVADLLVWYRVDRNKPAFAKQCGKLWDGHLKPFFGDFRISRVNADSLRAYRAARSEAGAANATVNRELQVVRKAFKLAVVAEKIERMPVFVLPAENNARKGFATREDLVRLRVAASQEGLWFRCLLDMAVALGWRKSELLGLRVCDVDLAAGTVRLQTSKNGEPRECPVSPDLAVLLQALVVGRAADAPLFERRGSFQPFWERVRAAAACPTLMFHDLRRTSAKMKRAAGVDTSVTMAMMGWRSEEMFRRYAITGRDDKLAAMEKQRLYEATAQAN